MARARGQAGAMVAASTLRAKIGGLLRDKVEISGEDFNRPSTEEAVKELLCLHGLEHPTQEQVEQAVTSIRSEFAELVLQSRDGDDRLSWLPGQSAERRQLS
jgi:hypothetical protein